MSTPYRSPADAFLAAERAELVHARLRELDEVPSALHRIARLRHARSLAGATALAGGVLVLLAAIGEHGLPLAGARAVVVVPPTELLVLAWLAAAAAALIGAALGARGVVRAVRRDLVASLEGDPRPVLDRLQDLTAVDLVRERLAELEQPSVARALSGVAALLPLTLHLLVARALTCAPDRLVGEFDAWIAASVIFTLPAHATLVFLARGFARDLRMRRPADHRHLGAGWHAWLLTTAAGLFPGILLAGVPTVLIGLTGLVFVPASFAGARALALAERNVILKAGKIV